jgi:hypothetical protein
MRKSVVLLLILTSVLLAIAPFLSVRANPLVVEEVPAKPSWNPIVKIISPTENETYTNGTINLCFTVAGADDPRFTQMTLVGAYKGDWMEDFERAYGQVGEDNGEHYGIPIFLKYDLNVTDIPYGEHNLLIKAYGTLNFMENNGALPLYGCLLNKTLSVDFFVRTNPIIMFPSRQNATFKTSSVPLNFTVDHSVTEMAYIIDGQDSVSIDGNTTLTGLSNGQHNVTVYATDSLGKTDVSAMQFFYVDAPEFPVVPFVAVSAVVVVSAVAGVMVYFKKRKR